MSALREAARQALEALQTVFMPFHPAVIDLKAALAEEALQRLTDVHQEIEAALEQPEQAEPVAWMYHGIRFDDMPHDSPSLIWRPEYMDAMSASKGAKATPLYAEPPRREWQGLSNGEIYTAYITATNQTLRPQDERLALEFARAIEAALKERNHE